MMAHDFERFPELTNAQMQIYYFESPHKQIFESFNCQVTKVHDGDTITVRWPERDFDFPVRFANIAAPEMSEPGGKQAQSWLEKKVLNENITIKINPRKRVEKWGRLLGYIIHEGIDVGEEERAAGLCQMWRERNEGSIPSLKKAIPKQKWS